MPEDAAAALDAAMPELAGWVGRAREIEDAIALGAVRRIAAALRRAAGRLAARETRLLRPLPVGGIARSCGGAAADGRMRAWVADGGGALAAGMTLDLAP